MTVSTGMSRATPTSTRHRRRADTTLSTARTKHTPPRTTGRTTVRKHTTTVTTAGGMGPTSEPRATAPGVWGVGATAAAGMCMRTRRRTTGRRSSGSTKTMSTCCTTGTWRPRMRTSSRQSRTRKSGSTTRRSRHMTPICVTRRRRAVDGMMPCEPRRVLPSS